MVIDLGDRHFDELTIEPPQWSAGRRRAGAIGLVVLALLLAVGGSTIPIDPLPLVATVPVASDAHLLIKDGQAFVLDDVNGQSRVNAYALPTGRHLWSAPVAGNTTTASMFVIGKFLIVDPTSDDNDRPSVQAFGLASGAPAWEAATHGVVNTSAGLLTVDPNWPAVALGGSYGIGVIDPASGRTRWTVPIGASCSVTYNDAGDAASRVLLVFCADGNELSAYDLSTGELRARGHYRAPVIATTQMMPLLIVAGVIVVSSLNHPGLYATGYRTSDLTALWSRKPQSSGTTDELLQPCVPNICVDGTDGVTTLDPHTGRVISVPETTSAAVTRFYPRRGVLEFVVIPPDRQSTAVSSFGSDVNVVPAMPEGSSMDVQAYLPSQNTTTWITEQIGSAFRPLGAVPHVGASCVFVSVYAACTTAANRLSLYRMPTA